MQLKPWHVPFSIVDPCTQVCLIGQDRAMLAHPQFPPCIVDLNNGDVADLQHPEMSVTEAALVYGTGLMKSFSGAASPPGTARQP